MNLAPNLTVAENIFLGSEIQRGGLVKRGQMLLEAQKVIDRLGGAVQRRRSRDEINHRRAATGGNRPCAAP
jgi:ABC-type sugar transport system ATPase subunit